jgi:hypothetical protein
MTFKKLQEKLKSLGLELNKSKKTVKFDIIDVGQTFEGTRKSNTIRYTLDGNELDKMDSATMALLYAKYFNYFSEPETFISKEFLDSVKQQYPCKEPYEKKCLVDFLKNFSKKLKINLFLIPVEGGETRPFKFVNDRNYLSKYIYFDFETLVGALNIPNSELPVSTDYLFRIKEWTSEKETRRKKLTTNATRKLPKQIDLPVEASGEASEDEASEDEASEDEASEDEASDEASEDEGLENVSEGSADASGDAPEDVYEGSEDVSEGSEDLGEGVGGPVEGSVGASDGLSEASGDVPKDLRARTQKALRSEELDMYNKIIDEPVKMSDYVRKDHDKVMLTRKQRSLAQYPDKTAKSLYREVKAKNIFNSIVPTYLTKCNLAMKRHGLQVIHITPHMCQLITKLGFGDVDEKKLRVLRTYSTSVQLRTALQLRNLLAQIILKNETDDSLCTLDAPAIHAILAEEQQTALLGVHRAKTDVVTSLLTFRPSSTEDRVVDEPELTDLWAARKLAFLDVGCAPSAQTLNKRLKQRPAHAELLLYYALLNIVAASAKRARKYSGVCATLESGSVLEGPLKGLGFREYKWASQPSTVTYALYGGDEQMVDLIDAVDKKIDAVTSPYMTELCKGGVCK